MNEECPNCGKQIQGGGKIWSSEDEELFAPGEVKFDDRTVCQDCYNKQKSKRAEEKKSKQQSEENKRNYCQQCNQKFLGTNWQEIHITFDSKKRVLCLNCWEQEKGSWKAKVKQDEADVCLYVNEDDGKGMWSFSTPKILENCLVCDKWFTPNLNYSGEEFKKICSSECRERHNSSDSSGLTSKEICNKNTERERERESNSNKNYLPWILGGIGIFALIAGLVWYFTKSKQHDEK